MAKKKEIITNEAKIVAKVVMQLKPEIKGAIESLRQDIHNDFKENFQSPIPTPAVPNAPNAMGGLDLSKLGDILKGGNIDMGKISQLMGSIPQQQPMQMGANGAPVDFDKLTQGQVQYMKMQQQDKMMGMILPLLLGQSQTAGNPMINEMMNRIFLEKINSSLHMDKAMLNMMVKSVGGQMPQDTGLTAPIHDSISSLNSSGAPNVKV